MEVITTAAIETKLSVHTSHLLAAVARSHHEQQHHHQTLHFVHRMEVLWLWLAGKCMIYLANHTFVALSVSVFRPLLLSCARQNRSRSAGRDWPLLPSSPSMHNMAVLLTICEVRRGWKNGGRVGGRRAFLTYVVSLC